MTRPAPLVSRYSCKISPHSLSTPRPRSRESAVTRAARGDGRRRWLRKPCDVPCDVPCAAVCQPCSREQEVSGGVNRRPPGGCVCGEPQAKVDLARHCVTRLADGTIRHGGESSAQNGVQPFREIRHGGESSARNGVQPFLEIRHGGESSAQMACSRSSRLLWSTLSDLTFSRRYSIKSMRFARYCIHCKRSGERPRPGSSHHVRKGCEA